MSKPKVTWQDKVTLWRLLADGKWHKAKDLVAWSGVSPTGGAQLAWKNTRIIRAICEAEPDKFISTQKGYKRADLATDDELTNAINDLRSRAEKMTARADAIDRMLYERQVPEQMRVCP